MGLFFPMDDEKLPPGRRKGFARYRQVLERDWKQMILADFAVLATLIPYGAGVGFAVLRGNLVLLIAASILGGMIAAQGIAAMYDFILRRLRDSEIWWGFAFKKSLGQNWRAALLPGALEGLFLGVLIFAGELMWRTGQITILNIAIFAVASTVFTMVYSIWWPQIVLFSQKHGTMLKNCLLFILQNPWKVLGSSLLQVAWWALTFLLLPWSAFLVPFLGIWYILLVVVMMIYPRLNAAFRIEEQIREQFPGQIPEENQNRED